MTFSQYAGVAIVPTLSRIVLAAVFITAGWTKFQPGEFTAEEAAVLQSLNVSVSPKATPVVTSSRVSAGLGIRLANFQTQPSEPDAPQTGDLPATNPEIPEAPPIEGETEPAAPPTTGTPSAPTTSPADQTQTPATQPITGGKYTASKLHGITLMLHKKNWPMPTWMAWGATMTELIGGALLAIGLFSRLWGLGLAKVMGVAMYLTSWPVLQAVSFKLFSMDPMAFATLSVQSALFVLAFGIFLTGAGPLSLDRFLFGSRHDVVEVEVEKKG